jgi:hypothetical protein
VNDRERDDRVDELLATEGINEPQQLHSQGTTGPRPVVPKEEQKARRLVMERLLASVVSDHEIEAMMIKQFRMTPEAVRVLTRETFARWEEEDARRKGYLKSAARRRIGDHIIQASKGKSWTAVANLEKVLASIEGTNAPIELHTSADVRVTQAVMGVLGEMDPARVRELVKQELELLSDEDAALLEGDWDDFRVVPVLPEPGGDHADKKDPPAPTRK